MHSNLKLFVTGGNGFIGSQVIEDLLSKGYQIKCLLRETSNTKRIEHLSFERFVGDIRNYSSIKEGILGCNGVIHLASPSSWDDINCDDITSSVIEGTKNVLNAAREEGNLRTVYVSSSTAINGSVSPTIMNEDTIFELDRNAYAYAAAKNSAEKLCYDFANEGMEVIIVNPAEVYGPGDYDRITCGNLIDFAKSNPVFVCSGGTSIVHVCDVAAGIVSAFERGVSGQRYFLGGENLSVMELAKSTVEILKLKKTIIKLPNTLISAVAKLGTHFRLKLPFNPAVIPYAVRYWYFDNSKAKSELNFTPRPARQVLESTLHWLEQEKIICR